MRQDELELRARVRLLGNAPRVPQHHGALVVIGDARRAQLGRGVLLAAADHRCDTHGGVTARRVVIGGWRALVIGLRW